MSLSLIDITAATTDTFVADNDISAATTDINI
jgi:hypothetical protein